MNNISKQTGKKIIYADYRNYKNSIKLNTKNHDLTDKIKRYIDTLELAEFTQEKKYYDHLKYRMREMLHSCTDKKEFEKIENILLDLKKIGGVAATFYPTSLNMTKQAKEHFFNEIAKQSKYIEVEYPQTSNSKLNEEITKLRILLSNKIITKTDAIKMIYASILACENDSQLEILEKYLTELSKHGGPIEEVVMSLNYDLTPEKRAIIKEVIEANQEYLNKINEYKIFRNYLIGEYEGLSNMVDITQIENMKNNFEILYLRINELETHPSASKKFITKEKQRLESYINKLDNMINGLKNYLATLEDLDSDDPGFTM